MSVTRTPTHLQQVQSIYRRALKTSLDWTVHRDAWRGQALYIRGLIEANKDVDDVKKRRALVAESERLLTKYKHPEPFRVPTAPGGSKYERNLPAPILDPPQHFEEEVVEIDGEYVSAKEAAKKH